MLRSSGRSASQARRRARLLAAVAVQMWSRWLRAPSMTCAARVKRQGQVAHAQGSLAQERALRAAQGAGEPHRPPAPRARPDPADQRRLSRAFPLKEQLRALYHLDHPRPALAHLDAWLAWASRSKLGAVRPAHPAALARRRPRCRDARADRRLICAALRGTGPHRRAGAGPRSAEAAEEPPSSSRLRATGD